VQGAKPLVRSEGETVNDWHLDSIAPHEVTVTGPGRDDDTGAQERSELGAARATGATGACRLGRAAWSSPGAACRGHQPAALPHPAHGAAEAGRDTPQPRAERSSQSGTAREPVRPASDVLLGRSRLGGLVQRAAPAGQVAPSLSSWRARGAIASADEKSALTSFGLMQIRPDEFAERRRILGEAARLPQPSGEAAVGVIDEIGDRGRDVVEVATPPVGIIRMAPASCAKASANQFRLLIHTAAYWLMHTLRARAPKTSFWRDAQFGTIRG
jgi:hypothetical protein